VSDLYSPISGTITAKNDALSADPASINADPYGRGWLLEVEISNTAELDALLDAAGYRLHIG
jgi:glycine cleavage system H protein